MPGIDKEMVCWGFRWQGAPFWSWDPWQCTFEGDSVGRIFERGIFTFWTWDTSISSSSLQHAWFVYYMLLHSSGHGRCEALVAWENCRCQREGVVWKYPHECFLDWLSENGTIRTEPCFILKGSETAFVHQAVDCFCFLTWHMLESVRSCVWFAWLMVVAATTQHGAWGKSMATTKMNKHIKSSKFTDIHSTK